MTFRPGIDQAQRRPSPSIFGRIGYENVDDFIFGLLRNRYSPTTSADTPKNRRPAKAADGFSSTCVSTTYLPAVMKRKVMFVSVASRRIAPNAPVNRFTLSGIGRWNNLS